MGAKQEHGLPQCKSVATAINDVHREVKFGRKLPRSAGSTARGVNDVSSGVKSGGNLPRSATSRLSVNSGRKLNLDAGACHYGYVLQGWTGYHKEDKACALRSEQWHASRLGARKGQPHSRVTAQPRHRRHDVSIAVAYFTHTHERQCSSDSRSAMLMNPDPQPHTYHPGPFLSPQRSTWLKYPWRCVFYIELCMEVYILY